MNANEHLRSVRLIVLRLNNNIRHQQSEIEELKAKMSLNSYDDAKNVANQLSQVDNEPVAWMNDKGNIMSNAVREAEKVDDFVFKSYTIPLYTHPANEVIYLTKAEIESGLSRVKWAELLIKQLPEEHEGRNSWLLNYGEKK